MTWAQALAQLEEAPPMDQELRTQYCDAIRREVLGLHEELRVARGQRKKATAPAIEAPDANPKRVLREALAWCRGTSLSIRVQPEDRSWAEELHTAAADKPITITLRPLADDPSADEVTLALEAIEKGMAAKFRVGIAPAKRRGDILIRGCVARSIGGFDGVSPIITFGVSDRTLIEVADANEGAAVNSLEDMKSRMAEQTSPTPWPGASPNKITNCPHDDVEVIFNEKDGATARCTACGETLKAQGAGMSEPPAGYLEVEMHDTSMTAITATRRKLDALAFMPSLRGQKQEDALIIGEGGTRFFVPARVASSAEKLGLVKSVRWRPM